MISDSAREEAENSLENWGRWARDDWQRHLDYVHPPTSNGYIAPIQHTPKVYRSIDVADAEISNEAIISIGLSGGMYFDVYAFIVSVWAHLRKPDYMARKMKCTERTIYNRRNVAIEVFRDAYREQVLLKRKKSEKSVAPFQ